MSNSLFGLYVGPHKVGVLSSRIWNLAFDPLLRLLNDNQPCSPVGFADDGALCFRGICPHTLVEIAQPFINKAVEWGAQNGLSFSVDKTSVVFFTRKYNFYSNELNGVKKLTINGVDIIPSESMTYLGVVLDKNLNWNKHIQEKVSKTRKFLAMIKPAIKHFWGLNPKRVQWIWKQIILPHLTYGCHVWGHSLTKTQMTSIKKVERLALVYYALMWKSTPTAGLQMILNKKPSHIEIMGTGIKSYICIKNEFQNNFWDGKPHNKISASHLLTLQKTNLITHEGNTLHKFESDYLREPFFNWNPPSRNTLMAVCNDDVDDKYDMDEHVLQTQNDTDSFDEENSQVVDNIDRPAGEVPQVIDDNNYNDIKAIPQTVVEQNNIGGSEGAIPRSLDVVTPPYHELLLKHFTNNYGLIAQKQSDIDAGLKIRALILKNKNVVYNYSFKIISTDNVPNATIAAAIVMCNLYLAIAAKGDTLTCSLGAGHNGVRTSITRNLHI